MSKPLELRSGKLIYFVSDKLNPNVSNSTDPRVPIVLPPSSGPKLLSCIEAQIKKESSVVWLSATIGFFMVASTIEPSKIVFYIWRDQPNTGKLIFSTADSAQGSTTLRTSTFTHVDTIDSYACGKITYYLTAQVFDTQADINIIGPISFNGAVIMK